MADSEDLERRLAELHVDHDEQKLEDVVKVAGAGSPLRRLLRWGLGALAAAALALSPPGQAIADAIGDLVGSGEPATVEPFPVAGVEDTAPNPTVLVSGTTTVGDRFEYIAFGRGKSLCVGFVYPERSDAAREGGSGCSRSMLRKNSAAPIQTTGSSTNKSLLFEGAANSDVERVVVEYEDRSGAGTVEAFVGAVPESIAQQVKYETVDKVFVAALDRSTEMDSIKARAFAADGEELGVVAPPPMPEPHLPLGRKSSGPQPTVVAKKRFFDGLYKWAVLATHDGVCFYTQSEQVGQGGCGPHLRPSRGEPFNFGWTGPAGGPDVSGAKATHVGGPARLSVDEIRVILRRGERRSVKRATVFHVEGELASELGVEPFAWWGQSLRGCPDAQRVRARAFSADGEFLGQQRPQGHTGCR